MFTWRPEYAVNIKSVDSQHQNLFAIGRELQSAMSAGKGRAVLSRILERMVQYTAVHFAHEEELMKRHSYPDFAKHKAQHEALLKKVLAFQAEFNAGIGAANAVEVLEFLKQWLQHHIKESDKAYVPCLKAGKVA